MTYVYPIIIHKVINEYISIIPDFREYASGSSVINVMDESRKTILNDLLNRFDHHDLIPKSNIKMPKQKQHQIVTLIEVSIPKSKLDSGDSHES